MREGKLREILEECLTAVFERRRTVEDCLSLYPNIASELEPLLRTAVEISDAYQAETPPWHVQERIRQRVLAAAQARARGRTLISGVNLTPNSWGARHWGGLGAAAAAAVAAVFVVSVMLIGGGGDGSDPGNVQIPVFTIEPVVADFRADVDEAKQLLIEEGRIDPAQIEEIANSTEILANEYPDFPSFDALPPESQQAAIDTIAELKELYSPVVIDAPETPELDAVRDLLGQTELLEEQWGEPEPATPVPTDEPEPTETPAPTEVPTDTEAPEPTPTKPAAETPVATEPPEATETPSSDTGPPREPQ
jgi:hypothetical protein